MLHKTAVTICTMIRFEETSTSSRNTTENEYNNNERLQSVDNNSFFANFKVEYNDGAAEEPRKKIFEDNLVSNEVNTFEDRGSSVTPINIPSSDIESALNTPRTHMLKHKLRKKSILAVKRLSQIRNLERRNKRLVVKNISLKNILSQLKKNGFGNTAENTACNEFFDDIVLALQRKKSKDGRSIVKFTPAIKKFALTLNLLFTSRI